MGAEAGPSIDGRQTTAESDGLARIRRRRRFLYAVLAVLPLVLWLFFHAPWERTAREAMLLCWVASYALATMLFVWSRCPRCRQLFHYVLGFTNPFSCRCRACGLEL